MNGTGEELKAVNGLQDQVRRRQDGFIGALCLAIIAVLAGIAEPGALESAAPAAKDSYYNLLVQGFRAGHLSVNRQPAPGLTRLADPYNPALNAPFVWDPNHLSYEMSYYKGKLYLYFGVAPALVLFWPFVTLTGHYLPEKDGIMVFIAGGFLAAAGLIRAFWRRYFPGTGLWVVALGIIAMGLATGIPAMLSSCDVYEVARSCGFAFSMLALVGVWRALHQPEQRIKWLLAASLAYGFAIGSRPSLLFGAVILLAPAVAAFGETPKQNPRQIGGLIAAAAGPITFIGLGLLLYNAMRFGNPLEFGWHYQLTSCQNKAALQFSPRYFWFNFIFYFWRPVQWTAHFPFVLVHSPAHLPEGYLGVEAAYSGVFANDPVGWFALLVPLAWRAQKAGGIYRFRWFIAAVFLQFAACALTLCLFFAAGSGYELDFLPALILLAVIGIFGLESASAGSRIRRKIVRWSAGLLLGWSVAFNLFSAVDARASTSYMKGNFLMSQAHPGKAIDAFQKAAALEPASAGYHFALANALSRAGRARDAIAQYQKALEIKPDFPEADNNLAYTLLRSGHPREAIVHYERAIKLDPTYQAYYNLAWVFRENRDAAGTIACLKDAVKLQPQFIPAQIGLAWLLATWPDGSVRDGAQALALAREADRLRPGDAAVLRTLAAAYAETGRFTAATAAARQALAIANAQSRPALAKQLQTELDLYQSNTPCRSFGNPD